jgi:hypothetical protein
MSEVPLYKLSLCPLDFLATILFQQYSFFLSLSPPYLTPLTHLPRWASYPGGTKFEAPFFLNLFSAESKAHTEPIGDVPYLYLIAQGPHYDSHPPLLWNLNVAHKKQN